MTPLVRVWRFISWPVFAPRGHSPLDRLPSWVQFAVAVWASAEALIAHRTWATILLAYLAVLYGLERWAKEKP